MPLPSHPLARTAPRLVAGAVVLAAVALLAGFFLDHNLSYNVYYLLAFAGVVSLAFGSASGLSREEWMVVLTTLAVVATSWLSYALNGATPLGWERFIEGQSPLLALIPLFLLARRWNMTAAIWCGAAAGAIACGVLVLGELKGQFPNLGLLEAIERADATGFRASAGDNPLPLAFTALVLASVTAAGLSWFSRFRWAGWLVWITALVMGLLALVLSGSRGGWAAVPVLMIAALALRWHRLASGWRWLIAGLILLIPAVAIQSDLVQRRLADAFTDVARYQNRMTASDVETSLGLRFDTFGAAWEAFKERPLLGYGPGGWVEAFEDAREKEVAQGRLLPTPHNMYLASLALRGTVGFVAEMAFLLTFAYLFGRRARAYGGMVGDLALAGLFVTLATLVMGLTWVPFGWWRKQMVLLCFLFAALAGTIRLLERQKPSIALAGGGRDNHGTRVPNGEESPPWPIRLTGLRPRKSRAE